jgi:DNA-binding response OmpR family regulator
MPEAQRTALIVDDDATIRNLLGAVMRRFGFACEFANDGAVALERLAGHGSYSIMLLDLMMPNVDGFGVLAEMRRRGLATPVIVITAAGPRRINDLDLSMVAGVLTKPFELSDLVDTVTAVCELGERSEQADESA